MVYKNIDINPLDHEMFMVKNLLNKKYIRLGTSELKYLLFELNICNVNVDFNNAITLDINSQKILKSKFIEWGFIPGNKNQNIKDKSRDISKIEVFRFNPSQFLESIPNCVIKIFSKFGVLGLILLFLIKIPIILHSCGQMLNDIQHYDFNLYNVIFLGLLSLFNTVFHEMGHAVSCTKFGGRVTSMGLMLFFFFPCFFVDVSDIYMLNSRKKSIYVAASGLMVNIAIGSMAFYMYYILSLFNVHAATLLIFYFCNLGTVIYNLIPFVKLDGYWIFSSAIKVTNLIEKSVIIFFTMLFRFNEYCTINVSKTKKAFLACWGFVCIIFRPIFWFMSTSIIRNFISNIPREFSAIAILLFIIVVLYNESKFILYHVKRFKSDRESILRMI